MKLTTRTTFDGGEALCWLSLGALATALAAGAHQTTDAFSAAVLTSMAVTAVLLAAALSDHPRLVRVMRHAAPRRLAGAATCLALLLAWTVADVAPLGPLHALAWIAVLQAAAVSGVIRARHGGNTRARLARILAREPR